MITKYEIIDNNAHLYFSDGSVLVVDVTVVLQDLIDIYANTTQIFDKLLDYIKNNYK